MGYRKSEQRGYTNPLPEVPSAKALPTNVAPGAQWPRRRMKVARHPTGLHVEDLIGKVDARLGKEKKK